MLTQSTVINSLKNLSDEIIHSAVHLRKVVLFDSYSRNEQHEYSDIDVALVAEEFTGKGLKT